MRASSFTLSEKQCEMVHVRASTFSRAAECSLVFRLQPLATVFGSLQPGHKDYKPNTFLSPWLEVDALIRT